MIFWFCQLLLFNFFCRKPTRVCKYYHLSLFAWNRRNSKIINNEINKNKKKKKKKSKREKEREIKRKNYCWICSTTLWKILCFWDWFGLVLSYYFIRNLTCKWCCYCNSVQQHEGWLFHKYVDGSWSVPVLILG